MRFTRRDTFMLLPFIAPGRYGVRTGELLHVDCDTGPALGIVSDR